LAWRRRERLFPIEVSRLLATLPPGHLIVLNGPRGEDGALPTAGDRDFEPVPIPDDAQLFLDNVADSACGESARAGRHPAPKPRLSVGAAWMKYFNAFWLVIFIVPLIFQLVRWLLGQVTITMLAPGFPLWRLAAVLVVMHWLGRFFLNPRLWLIPGGLLRRNPAAWRITRRFDVARAAESALIFNWRHGVAYCLSRGELILLPCHGAIGPALIAAWRGTARQPTMDELRAVFDPENA
jgi:hypothetical protein